MKNILLILPLLLMLGLAACQGESTEGYDDDPTGALDAEPASMPYALSDDEAAQGFLLLFDGDNIGEHWRGFKRDDVPDAWVVHDGAIHFNGEGGAGDLITKAEYESFELLLDWKISEAGNSGIFFHVTEDHDYTWQSGPEMQVLDNDGHPDAENGTDRTAGANYALHSPTQDLTKPVGEWNSVRLVVDGAHVEHWLNGEKVVEYELWTDEWEAMVAETKFKDMPFYGRSRTGHIALQDHDDPVWYRNIRIRSL